jgi:hypothetical protein
VSDLRKLAEKLLADVARSTYEDWLPDEEEIEACARELLNALDERDQFKAWWEAEKADHSETILDLQKIEVERDRLRETLQWLASEEAWEVTPQYAEDGRYRFNTTSDSVYATPWGFARAALEKK